MITQEKLDEYRARAGLTSDVPSAVVEVIGLGLAKQDVGAEELARHQLSGSGYAGFYQNPVESPPAPAKPKTVSEISALIAKKRREYAGAVAAGNDELAETAQEDLHRLERNLRTAQSIAQAKYDREHSAFAVAERARQTEEAKAKAAQEAEYVRLRREYVVEVAAAGNAFDRLLSSMLGESGFPAHVKTTQRAPWVHDIPQLCREIANEMVKTRFPGAGVTSVWLQQRMQLIFNWMM